MCFSSWPLLALLHRLATEMPRLSRTYHATSINTQGLHPQKKGCHNKDDKDNKGSSRAALLHQAAIKKLCAEMSRWNAWHAIAPLTYLAPKQDWGSAEQHKAWVVVWAMHMVTVDSEGSRGARLKLWFSKFYSCPWEIFRSSAPRPSSHCPSSHMIQPQAMATVGQTTQNCTVCLKSMKITEPIWGPKLVFNDFDPFRYGSASNLQTL